MNTIEYYVIDSIDNVMSSELFYRDNECTIPFIFDNIKTIEKIILSKNISDWNKIFSKKIISTRLENNLIRDTQFIVTEIQFREDNEFFYVLFIGANQSTDYYIKKYNKEFDGEVYTREEKIIQFAHENMTTRKICFKKKMFQIFTEEDLIKRNE